MEKDYLQKNSLSAEILPISKDSINEGLGEILAFPRNAAHNFQKRPASEKKEARTKRAVKASSSKNENLVLTQPKQRMHYIWIRLRTKSKWSISLALVRNV